MRAKKFIAGITAFAMSAAVFAETFDNYHETMVSAAENEVSVQTLPDWVPKDLSAAVEFLNKYGTSHAEGDYVCLVYDGYSQTNFRNTPVYTDTFSEADIDTAIEEKLPIYNVAVFKHDNNDNIQVFIDEKEYSFKMTDEGYVETDIFSWLPDCETEYNEMCKDGEKLFVRDGKIIFLETERGAAGYSWITLSGDKTLRTDLTSDCNTVYEGPLPAGGPSSSVVVMSPVSDGYIDLHMVHARSWQIEDTILEEIHKYFKVSNGCTEIEELSENELPSDLSNPEYNTQSDLSVTKIPSWVPQNFEDAEVFFKQYGSTHIDEGLHGEDVACIVFKLSGLDYDFSSTLSNGILFHETFKGDSYYSYEVVAINEMAKSPVDFDVTFTHDDTVYSYSFAGDGSGNLTETDEYSWMPDCYAEYIEFTKKYGTVTVLNGYIVQCLSMVASSREGWTMSQSGEGELEFYTRSSCNPKEYAPYVREYYVNLYKPVKDGRVDLRLDYIIPSLETPFETIERTFYISDNCSVISEQISSDSDELITGDVNADGNIDLSDLTMLSQHTLKDITLEGEKLKAADCNGDGTVDITDIALLKQYVMHDDVKLGVQQNQPEITELKSEIYRFGTDFLQSPDEEDIKAVISSAEELEEFLNSSYIEKETIRDYKETDILNIITADYIPSDDDFKNNVYLFFTGNASDYETPEVCTSVNGSSISINVRYHKHLLTKYLFRVEIPKSIYKNGAIEITRESVAYPPNVDVPAKPVIYLYPEETTDINVKLNIDHSLGDLTCTYPLYNQKTGWNVTAEPDSTLHDASGREYSYLFWEGVSEQKWDMTSGFVVRGCDTAAFLQEKLEYLGLTPREYNEFIVYWMPQMQNNKYNLVSFQTDKYEEYAPLEITPAPDCIQRVFMTYMPLDEYTDVPEQQLEPFERHGYTVIEWGGTEISSDDYAVR